EEAKGNPFFVLALARDAIQSENASDSLTSSMHRWLAKLPRSAARLLDAIAGAGRPVHPRVLAAAIDAGDISEDVALLESEHLIGAFPTRTRRLECHHDQIREAVLCKLTGEQRKLLNARLARALQQSSDADAEQLAAHFLAAGETALGSQHAELAADAAHGALAFLDAARWYQLALDNEDAESERARQLRVKLGEAYALAGHGVVASRWFLDAAVRAPPELAIQLRQRAAELLLVSGHVDAGVQVLEEVLKHVRMRVAATPRQALARLFWERTRLHVRGLGFVERKLRDIPASALLEIDACWSVALGLSLVDPIRATDFQSRHLWLALESGEPTRIARALAMEVSFRASHGGSSDASAQQLSERALALAQRVGSPHVLGLATFSAGFAHYLMGRWKRAYELLARAEQILGDQPGAIWEINATQRFQLNALSFLGDLPSIARRVPELLSRARESGNLHAECALRVRLASVLSLARDEPESAIAETKDMMVRWSQEGFHLQHYNELFALTSCALYQGRGEEAYARVQRTWARFETSLLLRTQVIRIEARHLRARACLSALSHGVRAADLRPMLERDIKRLRGENVPWATALATLTQALLDAAHGKFEPAQRGLELAEQQLMAGDMLVLAMVARFRRGQIQGGDRGRQAIDEARDWLTRRGV
ncbi:MAG TPA: hypothetical protein VG963_31695, partial [Polyangiaceae bacterium]|nr:hypothetical protein [Polyangiaceae bacterium]